jgi:hypothetical protein
MRKLSLKNPILVNISVGSGARFQKVSSSAKLIRTVSIVLSFQITSNLCGLAFAKSALGSLSASSQIGIILVKKSAFSSWSLNRFKLSLAIRLWGVMRCAQVTISSSMCLSSIRSCFAQVSLLVNLNRAGIALISSGGHLYILCFGLTFLYSISLSVKRINPSAPIRIFLIRALIAS